jgi:hypothetical protein
MSTHVSINADRVLEVDGRRFFPIGARHMPVGATPHDLRQAGFNAMRWVVFGVDAGAVSKSHLPPDVEGIYFYPYLFNRGDLSMDTDSRKRELADLVEAVREHPWLLCYEQRNEPASSPRRQWQPQSPPEGLIAGSDMVRHLDPHHPIRVGHMTTNLVSTLKKYNPAIDIVGCNPYVVSSPGARLFVGCRTDGRIVDSPNQTLSAVGDYTTKMMRVAEGRAVWMQLQAMATEDFCAQVHFPENACGPYESSRLYPSYWQMRFMAFHAIIRGATAMEWALHNVDTNSRVWCDVCRVVSELRALEHVLTAPSWPSGLSLEYEELGFGDWTGVETLVKIYEGRPWILAANTQFDPMKVRFSNLPDGFSGPVEAFFEPYEVRVITP